MPHNNESHHNDQSGQASDQSGGLMASIHRAPKGLKMAGGAIIVIAIVVTGSLAIYKKVSTDREQADREAEMKAGPHVRMAQVSRSKDVRTLNIIGEAKPFASVTLYAKVSGYLKEIKVDKGDVVKKGQILAIIDSPEINRAFEGAAADAVNKRSIADRMVDLRQKNLVSPQEADQATSDAAVSEARRGGYAVQKDYEVLRAPFDGTVTARFADPGALMQDAANSQTSALPVVTISQVNKLRVYTYIDQRDASFVTPGQDVTITLSERNDVSLSAKVTRVSGQLDDRTRMLLTEVDVDNKSGQVVAGSFVQVALNVKTPSMLQVPIAALINKGEKYYVPVITPENIMNLREIKVGDSDGKFIHVISGVDEGTPVALNLGSNLPDGSHVRPMPSDQPAAASGSHPQAKASDDKKARDPSSEKSSEAKR